MEIVLNLDFDVEESRERRKVTPRVNSEDDWQWLASKRGKLNALVVVW